LTSTPSSTLERPPSLDTARPGHDQHLARRAVAVAGLAGIALIHVLDLPGKIQETPYLGVGYLGIIAVAIVLGELLLRRDDLRVWAATAGLAALVIVGFVVNRTVGMPGATDDIGNWGEPLGLASLVVEGLVVLVALGRFARPGRR
jgi:Na+/proline symporter